MRPERFFSSMPWFALWAGTFLGLGYIFSGQIERVGSISPLLAMAPGPLLGVLAATYE